MCKYGIFGYKSVDQLSLEQTDSLRKQSKEVKKARWRVRDVAYINVAISNSSLRRRTDNLTTIPQTYPPNLVSNILLSGLPTFRTIKSLYE